MKDSITISYIVLNTHSLFSSAIASQTVGVHSHGCYYKYLTCIKFQTNAIRERERVLAGISKPFLPSPFIPKMEIDQSCNKEIEKMDQTPKKKIITPLLILNAILLATGYCGGPMLLRLYFLRGGKRIWLSSWTLTGGWPAILIPLLITYLRRRHNEGSTAQV